jgi:hypothetical protein
MQTGIALLASGYEEGSNFCSWEHRRGWREGALEDDALGMHGTGVMLKKDPVERADRLIGRRLLLRDGWRGYNEAGNQNQS